MSNIIISDLESNLELDRQALNDVVGGMGGKRRGGFKKSNYRRIKFFYEEKYQEQYKYKYNQYNPCHFDHSHCCSW